MKRKLIHTFIKKIPSIAMIFLFMPCHAQYQEKNEISIFVGGGYSTLYYYLHGISDGKYTPKY